MDQLAFRDRVNWVKLERVYIFASIFTAPYDIPVIHDSSILFGLLAILLLVLRGDGAAFAQFLRRIPAMVGAAAGVMIVIIFGLVFNFDSILTSEFQQQSGWTRAVTQVVMTPLAMFIPFYITFCLRRQDDWPDLIIRTCCWSVPIPFVVGMLQLADFLGVPGLAHFPFIAHSEEPGGFWRMHSVAREASFFGTYICVIFPFLMFGVFQARTRFHRVWCLVSIFMLFILLVWGFSKSSLGAFALQCVVFILAALCNATSRRFFKRAALCLLVAVWAGAAFYIANPDPVDRAAEPIIRTASSFYTLFLPLLEGNTSHTSIGTRFGMSQAAVSIGQKEPYLGVGVGQFGYYASANIPVWGKNDETNAWLSNDSTSWPSPTNLFTRLFSEIGLFGTALYVFLQLFVFFQLGRALLRFHGLDWWFCVAGLCAFFGTFVFGFDRDSLVNLIQWLATGIALAISLPETQPEQQYTPGLSWRQHASIFGTVAALVGSVGMAILLVSPKDYVAEAVVVPKPEPSADQMLPTGALSSVIPPLMGVSVVDPGAASMRKYGQFRLYWGARDVSRRIMERDPSLVRAVLKLPSGQMPDSAVLSGYITDNVALLLSGQEHVLTVRYRNRDASVARKFLETVIVETDKRASEGYQTSNNELVHTARLAMATNANVEFRTEVVRVLAGAEIANIEDNCGERFTFDWIERPHASDSNGSLNPTKGFFFTVFLSVVAGLASVGIAALWPFLLPLRRT